MTTWHGQNGKYIMTMTKKITRWESKYGNGNIAIEIWQLQWEHCNGNMNMSTWQHSNMATWKHGDMETWKHGNINMKTRHNGNIAMAP